MGDIGHDAFYYPQVGVGGGNAGGLHSESFQTTTSPLAHDHEHEQHDESREGMSEGGAAGGKELTMRKSCQHCRKRKIRCIAGGTDAGACRACLNKGQPCVFEKQSTMGRPPKSRKRDGDLENDNGDESSSGVIVTLPATADGTSPTLGSGGASASASAERRRRNPNDPAKPRKKQKTAQPPPQEGTGGGAHMHAASTSAVPEYHSRNASGSSSTSSRTNSVHSLQYGYPGGQHLDGYGQHRPLLPGPSYHHHPDPHLHQQQHTHPHSHPHPQWGNYGNSNVRLPPIMPYEHPYYTPSPHHHYPHAQQQPSHYPHSPSAPQYLASQHSNPNLPPGAVHPLHAPYAFQDPISRLHQANSFLSAPASSNANSSTATHPSSVPSSYPPTQQPSHTNTSPAAVSLPPAPAPAPANANANASASAGASADVDAEQHARRIQTEGDLFPSFANDALRTLVSSFFDAYTSSIPLSRTPSPPSSSSDPSSAAAAGSARARALFGRALSARPPHAGRAEHASADYARSIIGPLWEGMPVDIISLATTGKPTVSGPFALQNQTTQGQEGDSDEEDSQHGGRTARPRPPRRVGQPPPPEEMLFAKLLREDESNGFALTELEGSAPSAGHEQKSGLGAGAGKTRSTPYRKYAPTKTAVGQFFHAYFSRHPMAPLVINEKIFLEDLANDRLDDCLVNVIVGSALARAPCLMGSGPDARDVGEEVFSYVQEELLSRSVGESTSMETCQALLLWGAHEAAHMRQRRACAVWAAADVLLRERLRRFQATAADRIARANGGRVEPLPWREIVEQELTVNALWAMNIFNTWASLSLRLPHTAMSVFTHNLPLPPSSVPLSSSFQFAYSSGPQSISSSSSSSSALSSQHIVRRIIQRFSDVTHLISVIVAIRSQAQVRHLLAPDVPRPMAVASENDEAHVAAWLLELAKNYNHAQPDKPGSDDSLVQQAQSGQQLALVSSSTQPSDDSKAFLVVSHAILALYQLLPFAPPVTAEQGMPSPLPTAHSLKTALHALHLLSATIGASSASAPPDTRTRTQALLLDAMPRIVSLLELFTSTSLDSLDHFILVTSHREMVDELLRELTNACAALENTGCGGARVAGSRSNLLRASAALSSIAQLGGQLHAKPEQIAEEPQWPASNEFHPGQSGSYGEQLSFGYAQPTLSAADPAVTHYSPFIFGGGESQSHSPEDTKPQLPGGTQSYEPPRPGTGSTASYHSSTLLGAHDLPHLVQHYDRSASTSPHGWADGSQLAQGQSGWSKQLAEPEIRVSQPGFQDLSVDFKSAGADYESMMTWLPYRSHSPMQNHFTQQAPPVSDSYPHFY